VNFLLASGPYSPLALQAYTHAHTCPFSLYHSLRPEDGGGTMLRNIVVLPHLYKASQQKSKI